MRALLLMHYHAVRALLLMHYFTQGADSAGAVPVEANTLLALLALLALLMFHLRRAPTAQGPRRQAAGIARASPPTPLPRWKRR